MFNSVVIIIFYCFTSRAIANEILFNSNHPDQTSSTSNKMISYLKIIPRFSSEIDPNLYIGSSKQCFFGQPPAQSNKSLGDLGGSLKEINGCLGYKMQEEFVNRNSEATLTRNDHKEKLGFNLFDSMINFVKNNDFEKAYYYLQIYYDKDVLSKTDIHGNSIFHLLAQKCADPKAQDLLMMLTIPSEYYHSKFFALLKIKTTENEQKKIDKKCEKLPIDQVMKKFLVNDFITLKNNKGENVFDVTGPECKRTPILEMLSDQFRAHSTEIISKKNFSLQKLQFLFPDTFREEAAAILEKLPEKKALEIVDTLDFSDFNFIGNNYQYAFAGILSGSPLGIKLREKFKTEALRTAEVGGKNLSDLVTYSQRDPIILTSKNNQGKSMLELIRNSNPELYNNASLTLSTKVVIDLEKGIITPMTDEYLHNGYINPLNADNYKLFELIRKIPNEELRKNIYNKFKLNYDDSSKGIEEINSLLSKTYENISEADFSKVSEETCEILQAFEQTLLCDKFIKNQIARRNSLGVSGSLEVTLLNLIDQATLSGQNTTAYLLLNQLIKLNPELATSYLAKLKLSNSQLDEKNYHAFKPILLEKIKSGQLDCSPNRYRFNEFVGKYFSPSLSKESLSENKSNRNPCLDSAEKNEVPLHFIGLTKENHPILSAETFEQVAKREAEPYKDSTLRVYELTKKGEYTAALGEAYTLAGNISDIPSIKTVLNSASMRSYITNQEITECQGLCNSIFLINTTSNLIAIPGQIKNDTELGAALGLTLAAFYPSITVISKASGVVIGATRSMFNFLFDEAGALIDFLDCKSDCAVSNQLKNSDELGKTIKERRNIFNKMKAQDGEIQQLLEQYKQTLSLLSVYPNNNEIKQIQSQFSTNFGGLLRDASTMNNNFEKIAKLKVNNSKEMENLGNDLISNRNYSLRKLQFFVEQNRNQINSINTKIKNTTHEPMGDPTGAGGHGRRSGTGSGSGTSSDGNSSFGESGNNGGSSSGGNVNTGGSPTISFPPGWNYPHS